MKAYRVDVEHGFRKLMIAGNCMCSSRRVEVIQFNLSDRSDVLGRGREGAKACGVMCVAGTTWDGGQNQLATYPQGERRCDGISARGTVRLSDVAETMLIQYRTIRSIVVSFDSITYCCCDAYSC